MTSKKETSRAPVKWRISINNTYHATADTYEESFDYIMGVAGFKVPTGKVVIFAEIGTEEITLTGNNVPGERRVWSITSKPIPPKRSG